MTRDQQKYVYFMYILIDNLRIIPYAGSAISERSSKLLRPLVIIDGHLIQVGLIRHYSERNDVSNYRCLDCLLNHLFRRRSKKTSKLHVIGICVGNSQVTAEFPAQKGQQRG